MNVMRKNLVRGGVTVAAFFAAAIALAGQPPTLADVSVGRGVCAVLGLPAGAQAAWIVDLARSGAVQIYFQSSRAEEVAQAVHDAAAAAGLLGTQVFADLGRRPHDPPGREPGRRRARGAAAAKRSTRRRCSACCTPRAWR